MARDNKNIKRYTKEEKETIILQNFNKYKKKLLHKNF
jgi:hypothetical protein